MISYAQNFEDVILMRVLRDVRNGCYIDIGANDPVEHSVSKAFYDAGWRGLSVEPVPHYAEALRQARPDEIVFEAAVGNGSGDVEITVVEGTGLNTAVDEFADRHREAGFACHTVAVPTMSLADLFEKLGDRPIHWLKVDVEGMEKSVLESWRDAPHRPWVVLVEATEPNSQKENFHEWEDELLSRGYRFGYFDGLNRFYLHEAHSDRAPLLGAGPNPFDDFTLSVSSPYVGVVKEAGRAETQKVQDALDRQTQQALERERDLLQSLSEANERLNAANDRLNKTRDKLGEANDKLVSAQAEQIALNERIAALQNRIAEMSIWRSTYPWRAILLPDGTPKHLVKRLLFHTSGKIRSPFKRVILRSSGVPRAAFKTWMDSPAYHSMRKAYRYSSAPQRTVTAQRTPVAAWRSVDDKDELTESELSRLMDAIRAELKSDGA